MNIIQQQELARNSSEQQLIDLASQPNPSIMPPYLVTGELMRRKSIREKFAQAPQQSVSEEVLTEAIQENQPQGIGALTEDMATPMAAPQMPEEVMTESITETGIANLPAPNIGQNYAGGGIIGFANGGGTGLVPYTGPGTAMAPYTGAAAAAPWYKTLGKKALGYVPGIIRRHPWVAGGLGVAGLIGLTGGDDEEELPPVGPLPKSMFVETDIDYTPELDYSGMTIEDTAAYGDEMAASHRRRMGVDPFAAKRQEKLAALEADIGGSDEALNMALIRGGLGMAGGESQHFLSNLTEGLTTGVDAYVSEDEKQAKQQSDLFALQTEIARAERAEEVAIATTGTNSEATAIASNRKIDLQKLEHTLAQQALDVQVATSTNNAAKQAQKVIGEIEALLAKDAMFAMAHMDPEIKAKKDAARAEQYRIRGLDPTTINNLAMGLGSGSQPSMQGFGELTVTD